MAIDFMTQFARLPQKVQKKASDFLIKFQDDPEGNGINYEKINGARDKNLRSVRIGIDYRGIVCKPENGNVYMLLWVDHHDEAYAWAQNRLVKVNPEIGAIQVVTIPEASPEQSSAAQAPAAPGLFDSFKDKELIKLGLPEENLAQVRAIKTEEELDALAPTLPEEAVEPLFSLAAGYSLQDVHNELAISSKPGVDINDFNAALDVAESLRRFVVVGSEMELQKILEAPLEQWRVFLHPTQRKLIERDWNGPVRVLGGAGTGKTVVAMHRAKWLAAYRFVKPNEKILFTTFTKNLAHDIYRNLEKLCPQHLDRIEVINIDGWVARFLKQKQVQGRVVYDNEWRTVWEEALLEQDSSLGLSDAFYRDEWEQVVQPQSVTTQDEYFRARRVGRGTRVNRAMRAKIWQVFGRYRELLDDAGLMEPEDAMRMAARLIREKEMVLPYKSVIVDEGQDMDTQAFSLLRAIAGEERPNDIFIVGDAHQRIYRRTVTLSRCGIKIVGRSRKLRINYRTTEQIRAQAVATLKGITVDDLDGGTDDNRGYKSLLRGEPPVTKGFDTFDQQMNFMVDCINNWQNEGIADSAICIISRRNAYLDQIAAVLGQKSVACSTLKPNQAETNEGGVRLGTMHRVKGLEFDAVIIAGLNSDQYPYLPESDLDEITLKTYHHQERSLLYVSLTRAKKAAVLCYHGKASKVLEGMGGGL